MARLKFENSALDRKVKPPPDKARTRSASRSKPGAEVFLPDHLDLVRIVAMRGASDAEIARTFGVSEDTFAKWRKTYGDFDEALDKGRLSCDAEVVVSLYKRATGYDYEEEVAVGGKGGASIVTVKRHAIPDVHAAQYWLNNRQPEHWGSKSRTEVTGKDGGPIGVKTETKHDIINAIVALIQPREDGPARPEGAASDAIKQQRK
jgi:hypothetical protein